jgi:hypothetical protein
LTFFGPIKVPDATMNTIDASMTGVLGLGEVVHFWEA